MRMLPAASGRRCCFLAHACNGKRFVYAVRADMHGYVWMDRWVDRFDSWLTGRMCEWAKYGHGMQHGQMCLCGRCRMRQEQAIGACSMTLHVCASATKGQGSGSRRTLRPGLPVLAAGRNKEHGHWLPCPKGCCCKSSFCRVANAHRAGSPFLFRIPFFVLCALQLLPLQGKAHDVKPLSKLLGGRRQSVCTHGHALCQGAHQFVAQRASGCGHFVNGQHGAVAGLSPQRDFAAQARLPMWRML